MWAGLGRIDHIETTVITNCGVTESLYCKHMRKGKYYILRAQKPHCETTRTTLWDQEHHIVGPQGPQETRTTLWDHKDHIVKPQVGPHCETKSTTLWDLKNHNVRPQGPYCRIIKTTMWDPEDHVVRPGGPHCGTRTTLWVHIVKDCDTTLCDHILRRNCEDQKDQTVRPEDKPHWNQAEGTTLTGHNAQPHCETKAGADHIVWDHMRRPQGGGTCTRPGGNEVVEVKHVRVGARAEASEWILGCRRCLRR